MFMNSTIASRPAFLSEPRTLTSTPSAPSDPLTLERRSVGDSLTLVVRGELDLMAAPALQRELDDAERARPRRIVLDLAALDFIDSTGVHLLVQAHQRAERDGHQLVLSRLPDHAERLFTLTGLSGRLNIE